MRRATPKQRREFIDSIVLHAPGPTGIGREDERKRVQFAERLMRYGATLSAIAERECNGHQTPSGDWDERAAKRDEEKEERLRRRVAAMCEGFGCKAIFSGDPRGATLKVAVPDGYTDDWGREGICVPTS